MDLPPITFDFGMYDPVASFEPNFEVLIHGVVRPHGFQDIIPLESAITTLGWKIEQNGDQVVLVTPNEEFSRVEGNSLMSALENVTILLPGSVEGQQALRVLAKYGGNIYRLMRDLSMERDKLMGYLEGQGELMQMLRVSRLFRSASGAMDGITKRTSEAYWGSALPMNKFDVSTLLEQNPEMKVLHLGCGGASASSTGGLIAQGVSDVLCVDTMNHGAWHFYRGEWNHCLLSNNAFDYQDMAPQFDLVVMDLSYADTTAKGFGQMTNDAKFWEKIYGLVAKMAASVPVMFVGNLAVLPPFQHIVMAKPRAHNLEYIGFLRSGVVEYVGRDELSPLIDVLIEGVRDANKFRNEIIINELSFHFPQPLRQRVEHLLWNHVEHLPILSLDSIPDFVRRYNSNPKVALKQRDYLDYLEAGAVDMTLTDGTTANVVGLASWLGKHVRSVVAVLAAANFRNAKKAMAAYTQALSFNMPLADYPNYSMHRNIGDFIASLRIFLSHKYVPCLDVQLGEDKRSLDVKTAFWQFKALRDRVKILDGKLDRHKSMSKDSAFSEN